MIYRRIITKKLGELLVERKIITKAQLEQALRLQRQEGGFISQSLLKLGFVTEADVVSCLSSQYGFPYLPLKNYTIDPKVIKLLPGELARQCDAIPIDKIEDLLTVVMTDPLNVNAIEEIKVITGCRVQTFIGTKSDVDEAIMKNYGPPKDTDRKEKADIVAPLAPEKFIDIKGKKGIERRRFLRLDATVDFNYAYQEEYVKGATKNISAIGILFISSNVIPLWTFLVLKIKIPAQALPIKAVGQVIRIDGLPEGKYDVAIHLTHLSKADRARIDEYVLQQLKITGQEQE